MTAPRMVPPGPPSLAPDRRRTGDALAFAESLPAASVDLVVADPPWRLAGGGDFLDAAPYELLPLARVRDVLAALRRSARPGRALYCFLPAGAEFPAALAACLDAGWSFQRLLAWDKSRFGSASGMGRPWRNAFEPVALLWNGKPRPRTTAAVYPSVLAQRPAMTRTAKPPQLYAAFLAASTLPGELAVDPFCGLDPLAEAARATGRDWLSNDALTPEAVAAQAKRRHGGTRTSSIGPARRLDA